MSGNRVDSQPGCARGRGGSKNPSHDGSGLSPVAPPGAGRGRTAYNLLHDATGCARACGERKVSQPGCTMQPGVAPVGSAKLVASCNRFSAGCIVQPPVAPGGKAS